MNDTSQTYLSNDEHMTADEANAVVQLWTERQQEMERQGSQPSVRAMAEGLGVSEAEVRSMLARVRSAPPPVLVQPARPRKRLNAPLAFALISFGLMVTFGAAGFVIGSQTSQQNLVQVAAVLRTIDASDLPSSVTLSMGGYTVVGTGGLDADLQDTERDVYRTMRAVANRMIVSPSPVAGPVTVSSNTELGQLRRDLLAGNPISETMQERVMMTEMKVVVDDKTFTALLPSAIAFDPMLENVTREEVERRLGLLANQVANHLYFTTGQGQTAEPVPGEPVPTVQGQAPAAPPNPPR